MMRVVARWIARLVIAGRRRARRSGGRLRAGTSQRQPADHGPSQVQAQLQAQLQA
jgi:hypothetical protein